MTLDPVPVDWSPEAVRRRLANLGDTATRPASADASPSHYAYRAAAALLSSFDPRDLRPLAGPGVEEQFPVWLLAESTRLAGPRNSGRWRLRQEVRQKVLRELAQQGRLVAALDANPHRPDDLLQRTLEACVRGGLEPVEQQAPEELRATLQVLEWLGDALPGLPNAERVRRRLELETLLQPLKHLTGNHFRGRKRELQLLQQYVGTPESKTPLDTPWQGVEETPSFKQKPPLLIYGPGGTGKSTLVARFILDQVESEEARRFPFAYLDFDRAGLTAQEPLSLMGEIFRQLGVLYPAQQTAYEAARAEIARSFSAPAASTTSALPDSASTSTRWTREDTALELARLLEAAGVMQAPLLLVLDTFEQVQRSSRASVRELWEFLELLQGHISRLRVVIASRASLKAVDFLGAESRDGEDRLLVQELPLGPLDAEAALGLLEAHGVKDPEVARIVAAQVKGDPLSLKLAALVVQREGAGTGGIVDLRTSDDLAHLIQQEQIQGQLYRRILAHIEEPDVRALAHPGLVLRRITAELILRVLAEPCGISVSGLAEAEDLFGKLALEVSLVSRDGDVLLHRSDVRAIMIHLLQVDQPEKVAQIHDRAVDYYKKRSSVEDRAEELYHRLCRSDPRKTLEARWIEGAGPALAGAVDELPPKKQAYLAARLCLERDGGVWRQADLTDWERYAARQVQELLLTGREERLKAALRLLEQRRRRTKNSPLRLLQAQILERLGHLPEAKALTQKALTAAVRAGDRASLLDLHLLLARVHERLAEHADLERALIAAAGLAMELDEIEKALGILQDWYRVARWLGPLPRRLLHEPAKILRTLDELHVEEEPHSVALLAEINSFVEAGQANQNLTPIDGREMQPASGNQETGWVSPLTAIQFRELHEALLSAFDRQADLERLLKVDLELSLHRVSAGGTLDTIVFDVIRWAQFQGRLPDLIQAAMRARPRNRELRAFVSSMAPQGRATSSTVPTVREGLRALANRPETAGPLQDLEAILDRAASQIVIIMHYVQEFDMLHELQYQCYQPLRRALNVFPSEESHIELRHIAARLETVVEWARGISTTPSYESLEWISRVQEAAEALHRARTTNTEDMLVRTLRLLERVLIRQRNRVMNRLREAVSEFCHISIHLSWSAPREQYVFEEIIETLKQMSQRLMDLLKVETAWRHIATYLEKMAGQYPPQLSEVAAIENLLDSISYLSGNDNNGIVARLYEDMNRLKVSAAKNEMASVNLHIMHLIGRVNHQCARALRDFSATAVELTNIVEDFTTTLAEFNRPVTEHFPRGTDRE